MVPVSILLGAFIVNLQCYQGNTSTWILPPLVRPRRKACAFFNRKARVQHGLLVQRLADDLETQRKSLRIQPARPRHGGQPRQRRSAERRVGKEWVSTCKSRWSTYH